MAEFGKDIMLRDINVWGKIMVLVATGIFLISKTKHSRFRKKL